MILLNRLAITAILFTFTFISVSYSDVARADDIPSECQTFNVSVLPVLRTGLRSQRMQINQISNTIVRNSSGDKKVEHFVFVPIRIQADKALNQALRAVDAFPAVALSCQQPTVCIRKSLTDERLRIMDASRKIADVGLRLVNRYPDLLDQPAFLVREAIESRYTAFLDGLNFLPPYTDVCP